MARAKRTSERVAVAAKKAKMQDQEEEAELAPDDAPISANRNEEVSEANPGNPNDPLLEETDEPLLELIPRLIMLDLWK
jgi:hypothetical protein